MDNIINILKDRKRISNSYMFFKDVVDLINNKDTKYYLIDNELFILLKANNFYKFYYYLTSYNKLELCKNFLDSINSNISLEFTTKKEKDLDEASIHFNELGFSFYSQFARLISGQNNTKKNDASFQLAKYNDIDNLIQVMEKEFDFIIDNIPTKNELIELIDSNSIILKYIDDQLIFIQIFEHTKNTLYSRMTWISKKYRKPKYTIDIYSEIDSFLDYINFDNTIKVRAYYWVDVSNKNFAIGQKLGSKPDGLRCTTFLYNRSEK